MIRTCMLASLAALVCVNGAAAQSDGYTPPVISVGRPQKPSLAGDYSRSPHVPPSFAADYKQRLRVVDSDGNFRNRYYGEKGEYLGANWHGHKATWDTATADHENSMRRLSWKAAESAAAERGREAAARSDAGPASRARSVEGRWSSDCGPYSFGGGGVTHVCGGQSFSGSYQINGSRITINLGAAVITGTLSGDVISGTAVSQKSGKSMSVTLRRS